MHRQKTFGEELAAFPGCRDAGERGVRDTWDSRSRPDASPLIAGAVPQGHPAASRRCPPDLACGQDPAAAAAPVRNEEAWRRFGRGRRRPWMPMNRPRDATVTRRAP